MAKISVFLADWQVLFREGIHFTLSGDEDFEVIGEGTDNEGALAFIETNTPQIAILNIGDSKLSGVEATLRISQNLPLVSVILVMDKSDDNDEKIFSAIKCGASECINKDIAPEDLMEIIREAARGNYPVKRYLLKSAVAALAIQEFGTYITVGERLSNLVAHLVPREAEILGKVDQGADEQQILQDLGLNNHEVEQYLSSIRTKLIINEHIKQVIEATQAQIPMISQSGIPGKPTIDYVTRGEFLAFKDSLRERFKSLMGELI